MHKKHSSIHFLLQVLKEKIYYLTFSELLLQGVAILIFTVVSMSTFFTARFTNFQQKIQRVMLIFMLTAIICIWLSPELSGAELIFMIPSAAFFITHYLLLLRRWWTRMFIPVVVNSSILLFPFIWMSYFPQEELFLHDQSPYQNKRLMMIGDDLSVYEGNTVASPFFDAYVSKQRLEGLKYYEDASQIYDVILDADADIIIDKWDYFPKMIEIFPDLEKHYRLNSGVYQKISN